MPWNVYSPDVGAGPPPEDDELERAKQAADSAADRAAMTPGAWTSVYGYKPGDQGYQTAINVSRGKKEPRFVDLREEQLKKALDSVAGKRSTLGLDPEVPSYGQDVAQHIRGAFDVFSEAPSDTFLGQAKQLGLMTVAPLVAAYAPIQAGVERVVGPLQVWSETEVRGSDRDLSLMRPAQQKAELERRERDKAVVQKLQKDVETKGYYGTYIANSTPLERAIYEGVITALVPIIGFTNLPQGSMVKATQMLDKAGKTIVGKLKAIDWASEAEAVANKIGPKFFALDPAPDARMAFKAAEAQAAKPLPGQAAMPEAAAKAGAAKVKEPWEMTREEFAAGKSLMQQRNDSLMPINNPKSHYAQIVKAINEGKAVPDEVRVEWLDLPSGPKAQPAAKAVKEPWEMSSEELDVAITTAKRAEQQSDLAVFGGDEAKLKQYNNAQRMANSSDPIKQERGTQLVDEIEASLSQSQRDQLYGITESGMTSEDLIELRHAIGQLDWNSPEALGSSLRWAITKVEPGIQFESMNQREKVAYTQLKYAFNEARRLGWDTSKVSDAAIRGAAGRFSDPQDAMLMLKHFLKESPSTTKAATKALPAATDVTPVQAVNAAMPEAAAKAGEVYKDYQEIHDAVRKGKLKIGDRVIVRAYGGEVVEIAPPKYKGELGQGGLPLKYRIQSIGKSSDVGIPEAAAKAPEVPAMTPEAVKPPEVPPVAKEAPVGERLATTPEGKIDIGAGYTPRSVTAGQISKPVRPDTTQIGQAAWQYGTQEPRPPVWADPFIKPYAEEAAARAAGGAPPQKPPTGFEGPIPGETPSGRKPGGPQNMKPGTPQDQYQKLKDAIQPPTTGLGEEIDLFRNKLLREMYDRNYDLLALEKETGIPTHQLAQVVPGSTAHGENLLRKFIRPVIKPVAKDIKHLEEYMVSMRMQDVLARNPGAKLPGGISGHGGVLANLDRIERDLGPERFAAVKKAAQELWRQNDELVLKPLLDEGILDAKSYQQIKSAHPHYIPFQRADFNPDLEKVFARPEANVSKTGINKMELGGSERALNHPLASFEAGVIRTQQYIARNKAAKGIVASLQEAQKTLDTKLVAPVKGTAENSEITGTISFFREGKKETVQVPAVFARIAKGLEGEQADVVSNAIRLFNAPLRHGAVTYNPAFLVVNPPRDAFSALFREKLIPLSPDYIKGWTSVILKNEQFDEAAKAGVLMSGIVDTMKSTDAFKRAAAMGGIAVKSPKDALLLVPRLIEAANKAGEQATRVAVFGKLRREGVGALEAAIRSRDVTVDFSKSGTTMKIINQIIPFSNAGLQGTANTLRTFRDKPKWALAATGMFAAPTVLSRVNNMAYETSKLIPNYEYANNWVVQVGEGTDRDGSKFPIYSKIPKGPLVGLLTFPGEALFNLASYSGNKSAVELILSAGMDALRSTSPIDPTISGIIPPVAKTPISMAVNKNLFTQMPIVPRREQNLLPEQQYGPETSAQAIALGQKFKVSPRMIQFAINDYLAGSGQTASWLMDLGLGALGYEPDVPYGQALKPEPPAGIQATSQIPVVKRFLGTKATEQERQGWDAFTSAVEDTNRQFNENPNMQRLGIRLGEVDDSVFKVKLPPKFRAEYQGVMATEVNNLLKQYAGEIAKYPSDEDQAKVTKRIISIGKRNAQYKYAQSLQERRQKALDKISRQKQRQAVAP